jgi:hypothetical protein
MAAYCMGLYAVYVSTNSVGFIVYVLKVANMATVRIFEVISDRYNDV